MTPPTHPTCGTFCLGARKERSAPVERRIHALALSLIPVFCLGLVTLSFSDDAVRLESWRHRPNEGNFAQQIGGLYLIRHITDGGTPSAFRLISLTAGGNWASTHSGQHDTTGFTRFSDQHGVWARSGWREITAEVVDFNLDARPARRPISCVSAMWCNSAKISSPSAARRWGGSFRSIKTRLTRRRCRPCSLTRCSPGSA